jgi:hypothetical protein
MSLKESLSLKAVSCRIYVLLRHKWGIRRHQSTPHNPIFFHADEVERVKGTLESMIFPCQPRNLRSQIDLFPLLIERFVIHKVPASEAKHFSLGPACDSYESDIEGVQ